MFVKYPRARFAAVPFLRNWFFENTEVNYSGGLNWLPCDNPISRVLMGNSTRHAVEDFLRAPFYSPVSILSEQLAGFP